MNQPNPINRDVKAVVNGLVKSSTTQPLTKSEVMQCQPFIQMFIEWPENDQLSTEMLRLKCLTSLALSLMLRPSDIAPRFVTLQDRNVINIRFTVDRTLGPA